MSVYFYLCKLSCFGYYLKKNSVTVLETYITHEIISSNLVLIALKLYSISVKTLLNTRKLLGAHVASKGNGKGISVSLRTPIMRSDIYHTVLPANNTISAFTRKHSRGGATTRIHITANATTHLSTPRRRIVELAMLADILWTVFPVEVICQLHVIAQARESLPITD